MILISLDIKVLLSGKIIEKGYKKLTLSNDYI